MPFTDPIRTLFEAYCHLKDSWIYTQTSLTRPLHWYLKQQAHTNKAPCLYFSTVLFPAWMSGYQKCALKSLRWNTGARPVSLRTEGQHLLLWCWRQVAPPVLFGMNRANKSPVQQSVFQEWKLCFFCFEPYYFAKGHILMFDKVLTLHSYAAINSSNL